MAAECDHCLHAAAPAFPLSYGRDGRPVAIGQDSQCCHCPARLVRFVGNFDEVSKFGHGPYIRFDAPPRIVAVRQNGEARG